MEDVKDTTITASQTPGEANTPPISQTANQTPVVSSNTPVNPVVTNKPTDRTIPYERFAQVNTQMKELKRQLAEARGQSKSSQYDPNDLEVIRQHPYVQDLELKSATAELKRGAEDILKRYPQMPPQVVKAILKNPRGYVNETTQDVPNALVDIEEYLMDLSSEIEGENPSTPQPKSFPVAGTNTPAATQGGTSPAEVQAILKKPLDEWTPAETKLVKEYSGKQISE